MRSERSLTRSPRRGRSRPRAQLFAPRWLTVAVTIALAFLAAQPARAQAPLDGTGFGVSDGDDYVAEAMGERFAALESRTFRVLVPYDAVEDPALVERTVERIDRARAAGVEEIVVSFGARDGDSAETGFHRPTAHEWLTLVRRFIARFDAVVDVWAPANEPNAGVGWLAGAHGDGPRKLAAYYRALAAELRRRGGRDRLMSPEFHDQYDGTLLDSRETRRLHGPHDPRSNLRHYLDHYLASSGGFGDYLGWHPYAGVRRTSMASTRDLLGSTSAAPPIWISEVGAVVSASRLGIQIDLASQDAQVRFIVERLSQLPQVARVSYWHMINLTPGWDSALVERDGTPRPAWYTWCAAAHGGYVDPNCRYSSTQVVGGGGSASRTLVSGLDGGLSDFP
jgi:hypothetical protein